jgi:hypothetical protein
VRVQIILALVAALVLVAVPLYLWRRPQPAGIPSADAATVANGPAPAATGVGASLGADASGGAPLLVGSGALPKVEVSPIKTLKCQDSGPGKTPPERCDGVRFFEDGLTRAIKDSAACAPPTKNGFVTSFVLEFHFGKKRTNLFFGKSTTLSKSKRRELLRCVEAALPTPDWDRIPHQHQKYTVNAVVTYPPVDEAGAAASGGPSGGSSDAVSDDKARHAAPHAKPKPKASPQKKKPSVKKKKG